MMSRGHALSGVTGWLGLCAAATALSHRPSWPTVVIGAAVTAGAAILPDVDHSGSTVSRSLGPLTGLLSRVVSFGADAVQDATCPCCRDKNRAAHRGLTHTLAGALAAGMLTALACWVGGPAARALASWSADRGWIGAGTAATAHVHAASVVPFLAVFAFASLAVLGLLPRRRRVGRLALLAGLAAGVASQSAVPGGGVWWWLGVPVALGVALHIWGDWLTRSGVPALWPIRIRGCRWFPLGAPWRFRAGAWQERYVVTVLLFAGALGAGWVLVR